MMERDFMGLGVKQEDVEEITDAAPVRSSLMQWPFSKKGSSSSSLLSFNGVHEGKPTKTGFDSLASAGLASLKTTEAFDSSQKNIGSENQHGVRYAMPTYPTKKHDTYAFQHSMVNQTNLTISPASTTSMHQSVIATSRLNMIGSASSQPLTVIPAMPSNSPVVGTTDIRNASNAAAAPAQLTIFYNGSVCVYENVAPDKAQAIMLLAGNGPSTPSIATPSPVPVQAAPIPRPNVLDGFVVSRSFSTTPRCSSPAPVNPISVSQAYNSSTPHRLTPAPLNQISVSQAYNSSPNRLNPAPVNQISVSQAYNVSTPNRLSPAPLNQISVSQAYNSSTPHRLSPAPVSQISVSQAYNNSSTPHRLSPAPANSISVSQAYNSPTPHRLSPAPVNSISVSQAFNSSTPHRLSPAPVNSISVSSSVVRPGSNNDANVAKPPAVAAFASPGAVPQFRKKSLARFLEKRKERAITVNPYGDKQDCSSKPGAGNKSMPINSSGSCPAPPPNNNGVDLTKLQM